MNFSSSESPLHQLKRLRSLIRRVDRTNSRSEKRSILASYPDLEALLALIYDPYLRLNLSSTSLYRYLYKRHKDKLWQEEKSPLLTQASLSSSLKSRMAAKRDSLEMQSEPPETLVELFTILSRRGRTGNSALALVSSFLKRHGILEEHRFETSSSSSLPSSDHRKTVIEHQDLLRLTQCQPTVLQVFGRCLDRNLKAGFSTRTLEEAFPCSAESFRSRSADVVREHEESPGWNGREGKVEGHGSVSRMTKEFQVALGRSVNKSELAKIFKEPREDWFASRKLDGVRCIVFIDFAPPLPDLVDEGIRSKLEVVSISTLSRSGRKFSTLSKLTKNLEEYLCGCPEVMKLLRLESSQRGSVGGEETLRLVMDGEVCSLILDPDVGSKVGEEETEGFVEDFQSIARGINRKDHSIAHPFYFPFDLLTYTEFKGSRGEKGRRFGERIESLERVMTRYETEVKGRGGEKLVRRLEQIRVRDEAEVMNLFEKAIERRWEGIMLRLDRHYEGKRTSAVRKLKQCQEEEYTVEGIEKAKMRLPIQGKYAEREVLSNIWIRHKGVQVSVGSGFTVEQRIRYADQPCSILGKQVTVTYFEETSTTVPERKGGEGRGGEGEEQWSLRFPRIKKVWEEDGSRSI
ncbi:hypothetical protein IE53DRAFT_371254 [Violaceomyces palustris]|uniref:Uncharacterized protein n=1 Tax=Violaceomyces palustris TaxID=1673888 RepID=A0ACD0NPE0_9BASI|nr:hypothetical protein IE53DRAFT_371254 [Violaceomyces palustris]